MLRLRILLCALVIVSMPLSARAGVNSELDGVSGKDSSNEGTQGRGRGSHTSGGVHRRPHEFSPAEERAAQELRNFKSLLNLYYSQIRSHDMCMSAEYSDSCPTPVLPTPPGIPANEMNALPANTISDADAAYIAFARLRLTPPSPVIGPSPDLNRWKMAAVGYPLWLSVGGDPSPPAVSDAVADVHVRLQARVSKVVFSMGDRHAVSCTNFTTGWTKSVAGKTSPVCGYTYPKPSLPKRSYTVTATTYWSVAWSTSDASGVIPFIQASSVQLPVGELQVLVR